MLDWIASNVKPLIGLCVGVVAGLAIWWGITYEED